MRVGLRRSAVWIVAALAGVAAVWGCGFDNSLREYLRVQFWLPFAKSGRDFGPTAPQNSTAYAGMTSAGDVTPLDRLRTAYQAIAEGVYDEARLQEALQAARQSATSLNATEREEVDLIDAKIDLRAGSPDIPDRLMQSRKKLQVFLKSAKTPAYRSEARGWLAHIHFVLGEQTEAGKIYLDELRRRDSNLSRDVLLDSLSLTYGYSGGQKLLDSLDAYFDTPDHAAFAISLVTNPRWNRYDDSVVEAPPPYERIRDLLLKHKPLFASEHGAAILAELGMRTALRSGDPKGALDIAASVPARASVRRSPDFLWMLGAARFLSRDYTSAEQPLRSLFALPRVTEAQRAAAAYGLCGVYFKTGNAAEQIRMALWLRTVGREGPNGAIPSSISDLSVYFAPSGFDAGVLLDFEAPVAAMRAFLDKYSNVRRVELVRYSLAVRLAREEQYAESAELYERVGARSRAARMRKLAALKQTADSQDASAEERLLAKYQIAELLAAHSTGVYFNDRLWSNLQRYALTSAEDSGFTRVERERLIAAERHLKDQQEEYWRAHLLLRDVVRASGQTELGRKAAELAVRCLRRINTDRFGRQKEIAAADIELSRWLKRRTAG